MKKVKMMLTAITVFAVLGGALAFKAKSNFTVSLFTGTAANSCPNPEAFTSTTTSTVASIFVTTLGGSKTNCVKTYTKAAQ